MDDTRRNFQSHGHKLATSDWTAWCTALDYAEAIGSPLAALIDRGCDYAEQQRPVPDKYLRAAERLFAQAMAS